MGARQVRHRPRRATQLTTGTFSYHDRVVPQRGQCEAGVASYMPRGRRWTTTFEKEPTSSPRTMQMGTTSARSPASASTGQDSIPGLPAVAAHAAPTPPAPTPPHRDAGAADAGAAAPPLPCKPLQPDGNRSATWNQSPSNRRANGQSMLALLVQWV